MLKAQPTYFCPSSVYYFPIGTFLNTLKYLTPSSQIGKTPVSLGKYPVILSDHITVD